MALTPEQQEKANRYAVLPYHIKVTPDECDGQPCFVATHLELVGCTAHGSTKEEAMANVLKVRQEYIELLMENGVTIPLPLTSVRIGAVAAPPATIRIVQLPPTARMPDTTKGKRSIDSLQIVAKEGYLTPDEVLEYESYACAA